MCECSWLAAEIFAEPCSTTCVWKETEILWHIPKFWLLMGHLWKDIGECLIVYSRGSQPVARGPKVALDLSKN